MKKYLKIIITAAICICIVLAATVLKKNNKTKPSDVPIEDDNFSGNEGNNTGENVQVASETDSDVSLGVKYIKHGGLKYEFLEYEVIEEQDIQNQNKYLPENFYFGELPKGDEVVKSIDYETIKEECPELKDIWENNSKYTVEEVKEIYQEHIDVIEKHTTYIHPETKYVFIKCKITNVLGDTNSADVYLYSFKPCTGEQEGYVKMSESICYFDMSQNTAPGIRGQKFYNYTFEQDEELICTLGFKICKEVDPDVNVLEETYIGVQSATDEYDSKKMIKLEEIGDN